MRRAWIGLALLSASWLFGLSFYHDAQGIVYVALVVIGAAMLTGIDALRRVSGRPETGHEHEED